MRKYLWIGGNLDNYLKQEIVQNNGKILSSYISQTNIIEGIERNSDIVFDSINSIRLDFFPKYKKLNIKRHVWSHKDCSFDVSVGYLNIKYLAIYLKTLSLVKEAKNWAKINKCNEVVIFVFGLHSPYLKAALKIKKIIKNVELIVVHPDLPLFMDGSPSLVKRILKKIDWFQIKKMNFKVDKHILYSKHMADYLQLDEKKWIVMEGSINFSDVGPVIKDKPTTKIIVMYSGVIGKMYGIMNLVEAIISLGSGYELWLYGGGDLENQILEISKKYDNIKFHGYCSDRKKNLYYQMKATILISLINPKDPVSNYCFPSKIFEYLLSESLVVSTKINGIPNEYFDYLIPLKSVEVEDIKETLKYISKMPHCDRAEIGKKGRKFVLENKNIDVQAKKILEFIKYEKK